MPTYQYACTACDERLEAVQSFSDAPLTECPTCGGALRKVFSAVGVVFKGSGFYKTDSRGTAAAKADGGKGEGSTTGAAKGEGGGGKADGAKAGGAKAGGGTSDGAGSGSASSSGTGTSSSATKASAPASKSA